MSRPQCLIKPDRGAAEELRERLAPYRGLPLDGTDVLLGEHASEEQSCTEWAHQLLNNPHNATVALLFYDGDRQGLTPAELAAVEELPADFLDPPPHA